MRQTSLVVAVVAVVAVFPRVCVCVCVHAVHFRFHSIALSPIDLYTLLSLYYLFFFPIILTLSPAAMNLRSISNSILCPIMRDSKDAYTLNYLFTLPTIRAVILPNYSPLVEKKYYTCHLLFMPSSPAGRVSGRSQDFWRTSARLLCSAVGNEGANGRPERSSWVGSGRVSVSVLKGGWVGRWCRGHST